MHRPPKPGTAGSNPAAPATMSNHEIIHCGLENMDLLDSLQRDSHLLDLIGGVSVRPKIKARKIKKAIKSYFSSSGINEDEVILLVDNTIFGSAKQGLALTEKKLFAFSNISGRFSIDLEDISSVSPQMRKVMGLVPQPGLVVNGGYFISLPSFSDGSIANGKYLESFWERVQSNLVTADALFERGLSLALVYFSVLLGVSIGCQINLEQESDPGPPPWYV